MVATARQTRLLIVEDDQDTATTLSDFAAQRGFDAVSMQSRDDASIALKKLCPDVIFLDYWMMGVSASIFVKRVRTECPQAKVIVITAQSMARSIATMLDADGYFGKPIDFDELEKYLNTLP